MQAAYFALVIGAFVVSMSIMTGVLLDLWVLPLVFAPFFFVAVGIGTLLRIWVLRRGTWRRDHLPIRHRRILLQKASIRLLYFLLLLEFGALAWAAYSVSPEYVQAETAKIEAEGFPVTTEALIHYATVPDATNADELLAPVLRAYEACRQPADDAPDGSPGIRYVYTEIAHLAPFAPLPSELQNELELAVDQCASVFSQFPDASLVAASAFTPAVNDIGMFEMDRFKLLSGLTRLFVLRSLAAPIELSFSQSVADLRNISALRQTIMALPSPTNLAVQSGMSLGQLQLLEFALFKASTLSDLDLLEASCSKTDWKSILERSMAGERAEFMTGFSKSVKFAEKWELRSSSPVGGWIRANRVALLHLYDFELEHLDGPWSELVRHEKSDMYSMGKELRDYWYAPALIIGNQWRRNCESSARLEAEQRIIDAAFRVERYRLEGGTLPASFEKFPEALKTAWPTDPFDDQPLRFKHIEGGYCVYSVGTNLRDDGGKSHIEFLPKDNDIMVRVLRR